MSNKIIWSPLIGSKDGGASSQFYAYTHTANDILLHGTRGGGKTSVQLARFAKHVGKGWGNYWRGVLIARNYASFKDVIPQGKRMFSKMGARFLNSPQDLRWIWPTGEELALVYLDRESMYDNKLHGMEFPWIGFHELTTFPTGEIFSNVLSTNRSSFNPEMHTPYRYNALGDLMYSGGGDPLYDTWDGKIAPPIVHEICSTTNSLGAGARWVKKRYIDVAPYGKEIEHIYQVDGRETKRTQVAIFSCWAENLKANGGYLDDTYVAMLQKENKNNKNRWKSWVLGSWDISAGGAFDDLWDTTRHIVQRFKVPSGWRIDRTMDWGSRAPFSVCWWAEANGEFAVLPNGVRFCPPKGTLIQIYELYGAEDVGANKGINMSATDVAKAIKQIERTLKIGVWIQGEVHAGAADNSIGSVATKEAPSVRQLMEKEGIYWKESDKSAGSRVQGVALFRERLQNVIYEEGQGIYFMQNCKASIELLPALPMDPKNLEDVDTKAIDHCYDAVRYRLLDVNNTLKTGRVVGGY